MSSKEVVHDLLSSLSSESGDFMENINYSLDRKLISCSNPVNEESKINFNSLEHISRHKSDKYLNSK